MNDTNLSQWHEFGFSSGQTMTNGTLSTVLVSGGDSECGRADVKSTAPIPDSANAVDAPKELNRHGGDHENQPVRGKSSQTIRILLVDDHPVVRKGLSTCLSSHSGLSVVGEAGDGLEALRKIRELSPDLVLMDVDMPLMNGLAATECISRKFHKIKVLMLSMHNSSEYAMRAIRSGARGFILKRSSCDELVNAIKTVHGGGTYFSGEVVWFTMKNFRAEEPEQETQELSERQIEVLICVVAGKGNKEIAEQLNISVRTVESHRARIMQRLSVHTIAELTKYALNKGLISLDKSLSVSEATEPAGTAFSRFTTVHAG
jgi:DNA-binding NarL/FixJ family response regulator